MKILPSIGSLFDRLLIVAGAFLGSQIPQFIHQYSERLAGHVAELQQLLDQLRHVAALSNKSLDQYIQKFLLSGDPDFVHQGHFMQGMVKRWEELSQVLMHLSQSPLWLRPYVFVQDFHYEIAHSTYATFQPGINLSLEGFCYAGAGMFAGWILFQLIAKILKVIYSSVSKFFKVSR